MTRVWLLPPKRKEREKGEKKKILFHGKCLCLLDLPAKGCPLLFSFSGREHKSSERKLGRNRRPFVEDLSSPRPFDSSRGQNRGSISGFRPTGLPVGFHLYSGAASNCSKPQARSTPVVAARFGSAAISKAGSFSLALKCWKVTPSGLMGSWNRSPFFQS